MSLVNARNTDSSSLAKSIIFQLFTATIYYLVAWAVMKFATVDSSVTYIWPSSGIALAIMIRGGTQYALGVFIGAFATSYFLGNPHTINILTALGNTLEPLVAIYFLRRIDFSSYLHTINDYFYLIIASSLGAIASAILGVSSLLISGFIDLSEVTSIASRWWIADSVGSLLIAPFLLLFNVSQLQLLFQRKGKEIILLIILSLLISFFVMTDWTINGIEEFKGTYLLAIPLAWAVINHGQTVTAYITVQYSIIALWGLLQQQGIFYLGEMHASLTLFLTYFSILGFVSLIMSYIVNERNILYQAVSASQTETYIFNAETMHFNFMNKAALQNLGFTLKEALRLTPLDIKPSYSPLQFKELLKPLCNTNESISFETIHKRKDGSTYPVEINLQSYRYSNRQCFLASVTDISEQKQIQHKQAETEKRWKLALEGSGDGMWEYYPQSKEIFFSKKWAETLDLPSNNTHYKLNQWMDLIHPQDQEKVLSNLHNLDHDKATIYSNEFRILSKDGSYKWLLSRGVVLSYDNNGIATQIIGTYSDISKQKENEHQLLRLNQNLDQRIKSEIENNKTKDLLIQEQSRLASMGEMIGNIVHQWRQPLNGLHLILNDLEDASNHNECSRKYLTSSVEDANTLISHMSQTIDNFKDFFKTANKEVENFNLKEVVDECINIVSSTLDYNHIEYKVKYSQSSIFIPKFRHEFAEVLLNLIANSKEAIIENKVKNGLIDISIGVKDNESIITICDNGGGISKDILPQIFDPYFTNKPSGTGMGLFLSNRIIYEHMNGRITVDSDNVSRTCFSIYLPINT